MIGRGFVVGFLLIEDTFTHFWVPEVAPNINLPWAEGDIGVPGVILHAAVVAAFSSSPQ